MLRSNVFSRFMAPKHKKPLTTANAKVRKTNYNLIFDGNSLTAYDGYVGIVAQSLRAKGDTPTVQNYGVSGQTTAQMLSDVVTQVDTLANLNKPLNIVSCWEGSNDLQLGGTVVAAHSRLMDYCIGRRNAGFKVIVGTLTPRNTVDIEAKRLAVNTLLRNTWTTFADGLVDVGGDPIIGNLATCSDTRYYVDGVHFASQGHPIVAGYFLAAVEALLY